VHQQFHSDNEKSKNKNKLFYYYYFFKKYFLGYVSFSYFFFYFLFLCQFLKFCLSKISAPHVSYFFRSFLFSQLDDERKTKICTEDNFRHLKFFFSVIFLFHFLKQKMFTFHVADPLFDVISSKNDEQNGLDKFPNFKSIMRKSTTKNYLSSKNENKEEIAETEYEIMTRKLHKICSDEFDSYELEECSTWIGFIEESLQTSVDIQLIIEAAKTKTEFPKCHAVYILVTSLEDEDVVAAGAVAELYLEAKSAMISYIVTSPEFRGKGLGKKIVQYLGWHMNELCVAFTPNHEALSCLLVDVAQHRDANEDEEETKLAIERQMIWSRLGFSPVDFDMRYPGYLSTARYNVGCYRQEFKSKFDEKQENERKFFLDKDVFLHFLIIMYTSVWEDEAALLKEKQKNKEDGEDFSLLNPEVLRASIAKSILELQQEFEGIPNKMLIDDKFWR
jgi:hypothetical protein